MADIPLFDAEYRYYNDAIAGSGGQSQVQGTVASGTADSGNPVKVGGKINTTLPTFVDGNRGDLQLGTRGSLNVTLKGDNSAVGANVLNQSDAQAMVGGGLQTTSIGYLYNGTNQDRTRSIQGAANTGLGTTAVGLTKLDGTALTRQTVNISTATTTAVIAGTASQFVRVYKIQLYASIAQTVDIKSSGGTSLSGGPISLGANSSLILNMDGEPWFVTVVAEGLSFTTTTVGALTGVVHYTKAV